MNRYNDAINICLTTISESPVPQNTSITGHYEAELADTIIDEALTEILSQGYQFNTDEDWDLVPDTSGNIAIPAGALAVDATQTSSNYIVKNAKLYDKVAQSYIFTTTVQADVTWNIAFDDLHSIAQLLVVAKAKQKLYMRVVGVDDTYKVLSKEVEEATTTVRGEDIQSGDYSIFDDVSTSRFKNRTQNPTAI
jgi:ribulose bisphosphate carboxylase small subunit